MSYGKNFSWDERFELAKSFYEHHGHLRVVASFKTKDGFTYDSEGFELGEWVNRQRQQYRLKELTKEHYEKLNSIGMVFGSINDIDWEELYVLAQSYYEYYGDLCIPGDFRTKNGIERDESGKNLGAWLKAQRYYYNHGQLSEGRYKKIKALLSRVEQDKKKQVASAKIEWNKMYKLAVKYYKKYETLSMPKNFKTTNGYEYDEIGDNLGLWIRKQRTLYKSKKLTEIQIEKLELLGMVFLDFQNIEWERMYDLAKSYYEYHKNLNIPRYFKTKNGYEYDEFGSELGIWINKQYCRNINGHLTSEEKEKLIKIGMKFESQKKSHWNKMYALAKAYYEHHKNLKVSSSFKTKDGITYDEDGENLGTWINMQRKNFLSKKLSKKHIDELSKIGMIFENVYDAKWNKMYELARIYFIHYGSLNMSSDFKTKDGFTYSDNGENLGKWLNQQRTYYKSGILYKDRELKLREIGVTFNNPKNAEWEKMYALAKNYYEAYGNLKINVEFRTENGIDYEPYGKRLGAWISTQRTKYKNNELSQEQIFKLSLIGMLFKIGKDRIANEEVCIQYSINYKNYKKQIALIPNKEFMAKIYYLNQMGFPLSQGEEMHPIFFMSDINMQARYNISLEQIIVTYEKSLEREKVKVL